LPAAQSRNATVSQTDAINIMPLKDKSKTFTWDKGVVSWGYYELKVKSDTHMISLSPREVRAKLSVLQ
jgi:hypothetical protein